MQGADDRCVKEKVLLVVLLFFVAQFVAEYLPGDLPLKLLPVMIVIVPMYGGCAVFIRDVTRRAGRGWPTMPIPATACTLIEEGLVTQSLFNHEYLKMHMDQLDAAYISALGIRGLWTFFMFNPRTLRSMGVSIASVEALFPGEAEVRWLGQAGRAPFQARISDSAEEMEVVEHHRRQASLE